MFSWSQNLYNMPKQDSLKMRYSSVIVNLPVSTISHFLGDLIYFNELIYFLLFYASYLPFSLHDSSYVACARAPAAERISSLRPFLCTCLFFPIPLFSADSPLDWLETAPLVNSCEDVRLGSVIQSLSLLFHFALFTRSSDLLPAKQTCFCSLLYILAMRSCCLCLSVLHLFHLVS